MSKNAKDMLKKLLEVDATKRLGFLNGACDVRIHPFFKGLKWSSMLLFTYKFITFVVIRSQKPPIIPELKSDVDTSYFPELQVCLLFLKAN